MTVNTFADRHSLKARYVMVCGCGFITDLMMLKLGVLLGMEPAWARMISLICAMQVTFALNGLVVFRGLERQRLTHQWACYMATNAVGNVCNLLVFTILLSLHRAGLSNPVFAVAVGGCAACCINYLGMRTLVFKRIGASVCVLPNLLPGEIEP
jgi:putative flippase GtrA